jgi:hypothetical protein
MWSDRFETAVGKIVRSEVSRNVHAVDRGETSEKLIAVAPVPRQERVNDVTHRFFTVTQHDGVEKVRNGLGIERARATSNHQWVGRAAVSGMKWNATEIEHRKDVRIGEFVLQAEADDVEVAKGCAGLE